MTFNIHHGKGMDNHVDLMRIASVIRNSEAEVVGLNEVDKYFSKRSDFKDQIHFLADQLNMDYAFGPSFSIQSRNRKERRQYGNGLLSHYPIESTEVYRFNLIPFIAEPRSMLEARIIIHQRPIYVYITHLGLNPLLHHMQIRFITKKLSGNIYPSLVIGDFNMVPNSRAWHHMRKKYKDAWHVSGHGCGKTYPTIKPKRRLDYLFCNHLFEINTVYVASNEREASDHLPVIASLRF